ncbi:MULTISPECIES: ATP-NAD kinase family protein [unclassified Saccharopolyspora]|uniref:ATP-NAD kinase family protein n=1 Tax=Saccharopolyspora TaxID=1835 RepID=UPI001909238C|nr:NAD(+)/NADH kinase [Saccharopolyspora sp. HNM0986]MBK0869799.1 NAD(+)/NADH kinase [Saccharopolyspora sp. HNM0986]
MADAVAGIVANPLSGRDVRRLVARASVFPTAEKANMVQRLLSALHSAGVDRALVSTDLGGISAEVLRAGRRLRPGRDAPWPDVRFCEQDRLTETAADTVTAVRAMVEAGAGVVICLGGDGTARVAAGACGQVPLLALSTGTNNVFPQLREATVAGLAAGLVATGAVDAEAVTRRASVLRVRAGNRCEPALVDVAVSQAGRVGARAVWDPAELSELFCTFAEPDAVGLSSVAGLLAPSARSDPDGVALRLDPAAECVVRAPLAPGLVREVGVASCRRLAEGETVPITASRGVIAVDGEREVEFGPRTAPTVTLSADGPRCVDVRAVLARASAEGLLRGGAAKDSGTRPVAGAHEL